ncbi:sensor histidine kinase [Thalassomonas viridans]|uniref:histidine kinase n=1 Tax=Thalassomonas viridans TaxID=137584 RepID=A0AAF0CA24_9GAMM|nr:sensor histidine kinase [Thalassomonas viridans]WDE05429.1 sensor histidine kinase [Thalassomonas viridans]
MAKIPFEVSARAARLIGRENVASVEGAITELVKNTYDADATSCILLIVPIFRDIPIEIASKDFWQFNEDIQKSLLDYYQEKESLYTLIDLDEKQESKLRTILNNIVDMWIIDNGHGMSSQTIKQNWMVIGTDNKESKSKSPGNRIVNGAKGIGRFALDRLGNQCDLFSLSGDGFIHWRANWSDFEGKGKVLGDVTAELNDISGTLSGLFNKFGIKNLIPTYEPSDTKEQSNIDFSKGTGIKISFMRDLWTDKDVKNLQRSLSSLIPPKEQKDFNIYLCDVRTDSNDKNWIARTIPDESDYSIEALVNENGEVSITIGRQEFDCSQISPTFYTFDQVKEEGYTKSDIEEGYYTYTKSIGELLKLDDQQEIDDYSALGSFSLNLFYFKLSLPNKDNLKRFPYKNYDVKTRKSWLSNSGGVRLYRDNFRVRPYGEPESHSFDWLLLGQRVAKSPAAVTRIGGWRVSPQNVAGTISISKETNPLLADQSNREGIANSRAFKLFKELVTAIIAELERDRSILFNHFEKAYKIDNPDEEKKQKGEKAASKAKSTKGEGISPEQALDMAQTIEINKEEKKELKDENQLLRGLATLGTVLVSFTHELKQIQAGMKNRSRRMEGALNKVVDESKLTEISDGLNPYNMLERWKREDKKVSYWVDFALTSVKSKKRRRRRIQVKEYFDELHAHWENYLDAKKTKLKVNCPDDLDIKILAHEIDLDSVFFNLIINSVEVLTNPKKPWVGERNINIEIDGSMREYLTIEYADSGPGLSQSFKKPEDIFIYGESTKSNSSGDSDEGDSTGIGMWILKTIIDEYKGKVVIKNVGQPGFQLRIDLPVVED